MDTIEEYKSSVRTLSENIDVRSVFVNLNSALQNLSDTAKHIPPGAKLKDTRTLYLINVVCFLLDLIEEKHTFIESVGISLPVYHEGKVPDIDTVVIYTFITSINNAIRSIKKALESGIIFTENCTQEAITIHSVLRTLSKPIDKLLWCSGTSAPDVVEVKLKICTGLSTSGEIIIPASEHIFNSSTEDIKLKETATVRAEDVGLNLIKSLPKSKVEYINKNSTSAKDWTPLESLKQLVSDIESGESTYDKCVICLKNSEDSTRGFRLSGMNDEEAIGLLDITKARFIDHINNVKDL